MFVLVLVYTSVLLKRETQRNHEIDYTGIGEYIQKSLILLTSLESTVTV